MKKNSIFYLILIAAVLFLLRGLILIPYAKIKPVLCAPVFNKMNFIVDYKPDNKDDILLKVNNEYFTFSPQKNLSGKKIENNAKTLDILIKKGLENKIKNIVIFNDIKTHYFKDFSSFEKEEFRFCDDENCPVYNKYKVPNSVKYNINSNSYNYHSNINTIAVAIFALFSGNFLFLPFYILAFIALIYFINNKNEINFKINGYIITAFAFICGIITYSNGLLDYMPWTDEYYTIEYSTPNNSFKSVFQDAGNPPLYYILVRGVFSILGISTFSLKILPFIISILFLLSLWLILYKKFNLKVANIGILMASVSVPLVYFAQEARCYILQAFMTPILFYFLFKIIEDNKKKDYIIYGILTIIVSNIHYYEILLLISNYIFITAYFILNKRYKDILKFTIANLTGALFFLPFFIKTALNNALLNSTFNNWIPDINLSQIKKCVFYLFGGGIPLLVSFIIFIKNIFSKEKNLILIYSFSIIVLTILFAIILSYSIRPMLVERYLLLLSPLFIIFLCSIFNSLKDKKYLLCLFIIFIFIVNNGFFEKNNRRKGIIELPMSFSKQYYEINKPKNNIYTIINLSSPKYLDNSEKITVSEINYISESILSTQNKIDEILKNDKGAIIFTSNLEANKENSKKKDNYTCFFNSSTDTCLWRIENEK